MSDDEREEKELDLTSPDVVTKYKSAAEILNKALQLVISESKPKAKVVDICEKGDSFIREQTGNMYKNVKKKIERGVAFPTCISINNTVCHFSPLASDETVLEEGDILKIDMACHIDGFIAAVAHTHVLREGPITGRAADVIAAANTAAEVAWRLVRPGRKMGALHSTLLYLIFLHSFNTVVSYTDQEWRKATATYANDTEGSLITEGACGYGEVYLGTNFYQVLITNVGLDGEVVAVKVKGSRTGWIPMARNWGQNWTLLGILFVYLGSNLSI